MHPAMGRGTRLARKGESRLQMAAHRPPKADVFGFRVSAEVVASSHAARWRAAFGIEQRLNAQSVSGPTPTPSADSRLALISLRSDSPVDRDAFDCSW